MTAELTRTPIELPASARYRLVPTHSTARFRIGHLGMFSVSGEFTVTSGAVAVDDGVASVCAELDAGSFRTGNARRDKDVRSARFLDTDTYPTLAFEGELIGDRIEGSLRVRDRSVPMDLALTTVRFADGRVDIAATARLDRYAAGLTMVKGLIGRFVDIELTATLVPAEGTRP